MKKPLTLLAIILFYSCGIKEQSQTEYIHECGTVVIDSAVMYNVSDYDFYIDGIPYEKSH